MGQSISPVKTSKYRKFLTKMGCGFERKKGDHEIWTRKNLTRPVVFLTNEKEVEPFFS